jgi:hypothetical protein
LVHGSSCWRRILLENIEIARLVGNYRPLIEPEGSLPCSQEITTNRHPEPDNPVHSSMSFVLKINFNTIYHLQLGLPSCLFHSGFQVKILYDFLVSNLSLTIIKIIYMLTTNVYSEYLASIRYLQNKFKGTKYLKRMHFFTTSYFSLPFIIGLSSRKPLP